MTNQEFYKGKKIFITGHSGFKGSWLTRILTLFGAEVVGYALPPATKLSLFDLTKDDNGLTSVIGDIRDRDVLISVMKAAKPDIVFHLAAQPLVRLSYKEPALTYETNVLGTVNVLEALRQIQTVRSFVNVTTDKVYENKEWLWGYRENENLCGYDPYSNSKSCSELVTYSYKNSFFGAPEAPAISTARSGNVIGGGDYSEDRIIPDCVRAALAGEQIIVRNPNSTRPYQHVLECLSGYLLLAKSQYLNNGLSGSYNFGPDEGSCVSTGRLVDLFCASWEGASWRVQGDGGPHEANFLKLDCSKAKTALSWKPTWDIETAVSKTVEFARQKTADEQLKCMEKQIKEYFA
jgi:CDP-glucose 4,6-dehydratase